MGYLGSLGDEAPAMPPPGAPDEQVQLLRRIASAEDRFVRNDERFRTIQIAAILAVPLAGQIWAWLLKRRGGGGGS